MARAVRLVIPFGTEPCSAWQKQELSFLFFSFVFFFSLFPLHQILYLYEYRTCSLTQHNSNSIVPGSAGMIPSVLVGSHGSMTSTDLDQDSGLKSMTTVQDCTPVLPWCINGLPPSHFDPCMTHLLPFRRKKPSLDTPPSPGDCLLGPLVLEIPDRLSAEIRHQMYRTGTE